MAKCERGAKGAEVRLRAGSRVWKIGVVLTTSTILLALAIHNIQQKSRFHHPDDGAFWEDKEGRVCATRLDPRGPAAKAGVTLGDVLVFVDDEPILNCCSSGDKDEKRIASKQSLFVLLFVQIKRFLVSLKILRAY